MESQPSTGYVGLTDPDWCSFLSGLPRVDEVNFWQPHGNRAFRALNQGEPFFFKLRAPHKDIAGFGFFERFEALPAWLAWESFREMNGAPNFESMLARILRLRGGELSGSTRSDEIRIGCVMLKAPVFFSKTEWISPPSDWATTGIQQGKKYSILDGEGRRITTQCIALAQAGQRYWNVEPNPEIVLPGSARYGNPITVRPRLGQGLFSLAVRDAYQGACAVTGEHSTPVLDAAHIKPYGLGGEHRIGNGLLLRSDLHRLFDHGYVTVTPDFEFRVGESLREEFSNGRSYYSLNGTKIALPRTESLRPDREALDWHNTSRFKG